MAATGASQDPIMSKDLQARKATILAQLVTRKREGYALVCLAQWLEPWATD